MITELDSDIIDVDLYNGDDEYRNTTPRSRSSSCTPPPSSIDNTSRSRSRIVNIRKASTEENSGSRSSSREASSLQDEDNSCQSDTAKMLTNCNSVEGGSAEDTARLELKKLSLDQNGTFMVDFDPERSKREIRKMNRRLLPKEQKRNQLYDGQGLLLDNAVDLCDCLDKSCSGCHFPCLRCGSMKCGTDCRCNRKYTIDFIEVEATETIHNFPAFE